MQPLSHWRHTKNDCLLGGRRGGEIGDITKKRKVTNNNLGSFTDTSKDVAAEIKYFKKVPR